MNDEKVNYFKMFENNYRDWKNIAFHIMIGYCPPLNQCRQCGYTVLGGYCCQNQECQNPSNPLGT